MATPLHPVGHAMALGGVGVLGMEFEAPRKVMDSAKGRLSESRRKWGERRLSRREASCVSEPDEGGCQDREANEIPVGGGK